jgi:hypothetical protein
MRWRASNVGHKATFSSLGAGCTLSFHEGLEVAISKECSPTQFCDAWTTALVHKVPQRSLGQRQRIRSSLIVKQKEWRRALHGTTLTLGTKRFPRSGKFSGSRYMASRTVRKTARSAYSGAREPHWAGIPGSASAMLTKRSITPALGRLWRRRHNCASARCTARFHPRFDACGIGSSLHHHAAPTL